MSLSQQGYAPRVRDGIARKLTAILGLGAVQSWEAIPVPLKKQLQRAVAPQPDIAALVYPPTIGALAAVMACAQAEGWRVLPCGHGSKLHWGGLGTGIDVVVSTARLETLVDHAAGDLTVTVGAGTSFTEVQHTLAQANQFLAIDPAYPDQATMGGILATASTGSWRHRYNSVRDMVLGIQFVRPDGQVVKAGGRVVKNVAGYDLMKLLTGSYGTLGILGQATLRTYPQPEASETLVLKGEADTLAQALKWLLGSTLTPIAVDMFCNQGVAHWPLGTGWGLLVRHQGLPGAVREQSDRLTQMGRDLGLQVIAYRDGQESTLWQQLQAQTHSLPPGSGITGKIGMMPGSVVAILARWEQELSYPWLGLVHAGKGLGLLRFPSLEVSPQDLLRIRSQLQGSGGFLTLLDSPAALKQQMDPWGYAGDALGLMQQIKDQFDPHHYLSPGRFLV